MSTTVSFASMNCQGLSNKEARADTLNFLRNKQFSVYMLQDTHFVTKEEHYIRTQWGYECYFSNFASNSRGVAILFNNNFEFKVHEVKKDDNGNKLILDITIEGKRLTLINIYGPNRDDPEFYQSILNTITAYNNPVILAGDFNLVINPDMDLQDYAHVNNPKAREQVLNMMFECNLLDVWRDLNLEKYQYTWRRKHTNKKARLDFFLISECFLTDVNETKILSGYKTDHSLVLLRLDVGKFQKGTSYWKFNNSLLRDVKYVEYIKKGIENIKLLYAVENQSLVSNINTLPLQDIKFSIEDSLFFDVLLMEIRGKTIAYASHKKKLEENKEKVLYEEIDKLEKEVNINFSLLDTKRKELYDIRQKKMEGVKIRSRARWVSEGEKMTKYFCNMESRNFTSKCMNSLINDNGDLLKDQSDILTETMLFYKRLYSKKDSTEVDLDKLLGNFCIPKLNESEKLKLEGNITYSEILFCLKKSSNNTSPGFDGFTYEFFKFFWNDLGYFLLRAINSCFDNENLLESLKRGVITCIPKGNKDKLFLKNWRPISLLNTSYKLASSCIAERLKTVLPKIINEDQTGFITGRYIGENLRILYDTIFYTEKQQVPGMLLLIDFEKAFDSVSWDFLFKTLDFFNFGSDFKKWVKMFYKNSQSCVIVNGHLSDWFYLHRGCRQGDPLSPYLFIVCAEILAALIRNNDGIRGIRIGNVEVLISQYADDTSIILDGTKTSLENCLNVLKLYANASGLCINIDKTKVVWIGSKKGSNEKFCERYSLHWEKDEFSVLGVKFPHNLKEIVELNYNEKIKEMRKFFLNWSKRILTPLGKTIVIKSLALSKINHLILALPAPSKKIIDEIQKMFYDYLWNKGPDKIKRTVTIQNYNEGGFRMVDVNMFINALKITWIKKILTNENKYSFIVREVVPEIFESFKFGNVFLDINGIQIENSFWKDVAVSLNLFVKQTRPSSWSELLGVPIWHNCFIKVGGSAVFYRNWMENGIILINDLLDVNGELINYNTFRTKFSVNTNVLQFEGLIRSIKKFISTFKFEPFQYRHDNPICPFPLSCILKNKKGCRNIYDKFISKNKLPLSIAKWQRELNPICVVDWGKILEIPFKTTNDTNLRWLQMRINHRILGTNYLLSKMKLKSDDKCTFCKLEKETIRHIFWDCESVAYFWEGLQFLLRENCDLKTIRFVITDIIFGNPNFEKLLNEILLLGKRFIFRMKMENKIPSLIAFQKILSFHYHCDKYTAAKCQTQHIFEQKWDKYKELF